MANERLDFDIRLDILDGDYYRAASLTKHPQIHPRSGYMVHQLLLDSPIRLDIIPKIANICRNEITLSITPYSREENCLEQHGEFLTILANSILVRLTVEDGLNGFTRLRNISFTVKKNMAEKNDHCHCVQSLTITRYVQEEIYIKTYLVQFE